jgi:predicted DCC family thiol-disulfide oxidoreductase YuxK
VGSGVWRTDHQTMYSSATSGILRASIIHTNIQAPPDTQGSYPSLQADEPLIDLLYDADCGFCKWCTAKVLAWDRDRRVRPVPIEDPEMLSSWHLVDADGRVYSAGAAFAPLLRLLPGGRPLAGLAARFPRAVEWAYRLVADNRSLFGKLVTSGARERASRRIRERS